MKLFGLGLLILGPFSLCVVLLQAAPSTAVPITISDEGSRVEEASYPSGKSSSNERPSNRLESSSLTPEDTSTPAIGKERQSCSTLCAIQQCLPLYFS